MPPVGSAAAMYDICPRRRCQSFDRFSRP